MSFRRSEPRPFLTVTPRYCRQVLPPYRHVPGRTPHPVRHPDGHLFGIPDAQPAPFDPDGWQDIQEYLFGVDLFNLAYYWEAHESWEALWKTTDRSCTAGLFLQGCIQASAALLKRELGVQRGHRSLTRAATARLVRVSERFPIYCGIELACWIVRLRRIALAHLGDCWPADPRIKLCGMPVVDAKQ